MKHKLVLAFYNHSAIQKECSKPCQYIRLETQIKNTGPPPPSRTHLEVKGRYTKINVCI